MRLSEDGIEPVEISKVYLGLGSNLGDRFANLELAIDKLSLSELKIANVSKVYETDPLYYLPQPKFLNAACQVMTDLDPHDLLGVTQSIEKEIGREFSFLNAPRIIDIDILFFGGLCLTSKNLTIPHPLLHERAFALMPLVDLVPNMRHPVLKKTLSKLLYMVEGKDGVCTYKEQINLQAI